MYVMSCPGGSSPRCRGGYAVGVTGACCLYVRATGVMLFFLSKKYFQSRNCLREIRASLEQEKP